MKFPEKFRMTSYPAPRHMHTVAGDAFGMFKIPLAIERGTSKVNIGWILCLASSGMGWEHVSVSLRKADFSYPMHRCPTWEEMCMVKDLFWDEHETVVQYHPPKSEHVSNHPYCLHMWRPIDQELPRPQSIMVGTTAVNIQSL